MLSMTHRLGTLLRESGAANNPYPTSFGGLSSLSAPTRRTSVTPSPITEAQQSAVTPSPITEAATAKRATAAAATAAERGTASAAAAESDAATASSRLLYDPLLGRHVTIQVCGWLCM